MTRTLQALQEVQSQNDGVLLEANLQELIDFVYPKWDTKDKEEFDQIFRYLSEAVHQELSPFIYDKHREEEFEKQFLKKSEQALMMFFFLGWFVKSPDKDFKIEDCSKSLLKDLKPIIDARTSKPANSQKTA